MYNFYFEGQVVVQSTRGLCYKNDTGRQRLAVTSNNLKNIQFCQLVCLFDNFSKFRWRGHKGNLHHMMSFAGAGRLRLMRFWCGVVRSWPGVVWLGAVMHCTTQMLTTPNPHQPGSTHTNKISLNLPYLSTFQSGTLDHPSQ